MTEFTQDALLHLHSFDKRQRQLTELFRPALEVIKKELVWIPVTEFDHLHSDDFRLPKVVQFYDALGVDCVFLLYQPKRHLYDILIVPVMYLKSEETMMLFLTERNMGRSWIANALNQRDNSSLYTTITHW